MAKNPHPVDIHVGSRVRLRRTLLGMSQEKLGNAVSLTFQQIQKYERGANRIGSSRLFQFSQILNVPVSFFFDDMPAEVGPVPREIDDANAGADEETRYTRRETLELVRAYYQIKDRRLRKMLRETRRWPRPTRANRNAAGRCPASL